MPFINWIGVESTDVQLLRFRGAARLVRQLGLPCRGIPAAPCGDAGAREGLAAQP